MPDRLPDAIAEYRAALRSDPAYADAHINLGNVLVRKAGGMPEAVAEYETALQIDPGNAYAHYNLGNLLASVPGKLPDAIAEYRAALAVDGNAGQDGGCHRRVSGGNPQSTRIGGRAFQPGETPSANARPDSGRHRRT
jgi:tetratricopeptide (TPR) repeat protein